VEPARLVELRLTDFKTFHDEVLPLGHLTVLIGGNATGKSNALDALLVLSRLASGLALQEALDGSRLSASPIRGGSDGCAPLGKDGFKIGCRIEVGDKLLDLDIEIRTSPELRFVSELVVDSATGRTIFELDPRHRAPILISGAAHLLSRSDFADKPEIFTAVELLTRIGTACEAVFPMDPDPRVMRAYVPVQEGELQADATNLSATIETIRARDPEGFARLEELAVAMSNGRLTRLDRATTEFGEVQLVLDEHGTRVPARLASDGTLRFLAFVSALLSAPKIDDEPAAERLIMIEEIERGLYPAQAGLLLDLMRRERDRRAASIILTTHSPALLSALKADQHRDVIVCSRDPDDGRSHLTRLTDLPGYVELMAAGGLGDALSTGHLTKALKERPSMSPGFSQFLESL
jgi:hypothetical protein